MGLEYISQPQVFLSPITAVGGIQNGLYTSPLPPLYTSFYTWTSTLPVTATDFYLDGIETLTDRPGSFIVTVGGVVQSPTSYVVDPNTRVLTLDTAVNPDTDIIVTQIGTIAASSLNITDLTATNSQFFNSTFLDITANNSVFANVTSNYLQALDSLLTNITADNVTVLSSAFVGSTIFNFVTASNFVALSSTLFNTQTVVALTSTISLTATNALFTGPISAIGLVNINNNLTVNGNISSTGNISTSSLSLSNITFTNEFTNATTLTATTTVIKVLVDNVPKYIPLFDIN